LPCVTLLDGELWQIPMLPQQQLPTTDDTDPETNSPSDPKPGDPKPVVFQADFGKAAGDKSRGELIKDLEKIGLKLKGQSPDESFMEFVDCTGVTRAKIHPPDQVTITDHLYLYDSGGNPLDINLKPVAVNSADAHIPIQAK
jgi:hypothetical protein